MNRDFSWVKFEAFYTWYYSFSKKFMDATEIDLVYGKFKERERAGAIRYQQKEGFRLVLPD